MNLMSHLGLIVCCALTAGIIGGTVLWMEQNAPPLTADDALAQATQKVSEYCAQKKLNPCALKLVNATAPTTWLSMTEGTGAAHWQFEFYSSRQGALKVKVPVNGQKHTASAQRF